MGAVEDAGEGDGLAPEGGAEGVDGAELGDEDLLLVEALPLALLRLLRAGGQRNALAVHVPRNRSDVNLSRKEKVCTASQSFNHHGRIKYGRGGRKHNSSKESLTWEIDYVSCS